MHEEIEYAEMLEIPVSTVNVIRKKSRRKKASRFTENEPSLKDSVINQVNNHVEDAPETVSVDAEVFAEGANSEGFVDFDPIPDRIDTVRLFADEQERKAAFEEEYSFDYKENEGGRYALKEETRAQKAARITLGTEFALACALCGAIFLTNVFMPNSAVNTFFRAVNNSDATVATTDNRSYSDFELSPVISELSDAELSLSAAGILSFTDACCVYPAADGKVSEISKSADGTYTLKISHSDSFTGVIGGLDDVYYDVGDRVKCNVPVGYSKGEAEVQVTMYSGGVLLNCFQITEENCLAWLEE
jgi:hypothetical protein